MLLVCCASRLKLTFLFKKKKVCFIFSDYKHDTVWNRLYEKETYITYSVINVVTYVILDIFEVIFDADGMLFFFLFLLLLLLFFRFLHVCAEFSEETLPPPVLHGVYTNKQYMHTYLHLYFDRTLTTLNANTQLTALVMIKQNYMRRYELQQMK